MILLGLDAVALCGVWSACSYWWVLRYRETRDEVVQQRLSVESEKNRSFALVLKSEFQGAEVKAQRVMDNHTHGQAAADRSTASLLIQRVADGVGRKAYYFQGSGADYRSGRCYSREYYWAKDLMAPYQSFEPGESDIISMVDVDYYVDMEEMMCDYFQPYMLYTFTPSRAARDRGDHGFCFDQEGRVKYNVAGGGWYSHPVWDWDGDSIRVYKYVFGYKAVMCCYAIERRQIDEDHQVILLVPLARVTNPLRIWQTENRVEARGMRHFNPVVGQFVRFYANKHSGLEVVTGKVNEYSSNSVPASVDSIIASAGATISGKLTLMTVKSKLRDGGEDEEKYLKAAEVLLEFHVKRLSTNARVSLADPVRRFQWLPKGTEPDPDAKPGMTAFMRPILDGGFVPDVTAGNEQQFVDKRVKQPQGKELPMDSFLLRTMEEFVQRLIPDSQVGSLIPVGVEEVYERQNRPSQRAILHAADQGQPECVTKQFMKREAYGRVNNPRGISTINGVDKTVFSRYMYAFTDHIMKHQQWYAFGKSPAEVAARVAAIALCATKTASNTDFKTMDGKHSNLLSFLEKMTYTRAFEEKYHDELIECFNRHHHLRAKTTFGITYETEYQRLSGGADTSAANTLDTAFIAYLTYRMMEHSPEEAWRSLGIYGGDDGFSGDMDPTTAKRAAARVGQDLDLEVVKRGELGVKFLARRYGPDVWTGDTNSCCDIKRQLAKFHLTVNLPSKITPQVKLAEKSYAFYLTDANTPVVGELVRRVLTLFPRDKTTFRNELGLWGIEHDGDRQYLNEQAEWMEDLVTAELPDFDTARFRGWLREADGDTILNPPEFAEPLPPHPKPGDVAVDGDIISTPDDDGGDGGTASSTATDADDKALFRARKPKAKRPSRQVGIETPPTRVVNDGKGKTAGLKSTAAKPGKMKPKSKIANAPK